MAGVPVRAGGGAVRVAGGAAVGAQRVRRLPAQRVPAASLGRLDVEPARHRGVAVRTQWAQQEGFASAGPFSYSTGRRIADGAVWTHRRNHAKLRPAKRHAQIKYLERDFAELFLRALAGLTPDGSPDEAYRGRELGRNAAVGRLALASRVAAARSLPTCWSTRSRRCRPGGARCRWRSRWDRARPRAASPARPGSTTTPWSRSGTTCAWNARSRRGAAGGSRRRGGRAAAGARPGLGGRPRGSPGCAARGDPDPGRSGCAGCPGRRGVPARAGLHPVPVLRLGHGVRRTSQRIRRRFEPRFPIREPAPAAGHRPRCTPSSG